MTFFIFKFFIIKTFCFFNDEVKEILERESLSNYSMSLHESGSKLKSESSYLLNSYSNEESLCNIINGLYKKKVFYYRTYIPPALSEFTP